MIVEIKKVWERNETQGTSRDGSTFASSRQGIEGIVNGKKVRLTAFGCPDLSGFANTTVDIMQYQEKPAYNGVPQYQLGSKTTITPVATGMSKEDVHDMFEGHVRKELQKPQGSLPVGNLSQDVDYTTEVRIERLMTIYRLVDSSNKRSMTGLSQDNLVKMAIHLAIEENKRK